MKKPLALRPRGRLRLKYSTAVFDAHGARPVAKLPQCPLRCSLRCSVRSTARQRAIHRASSSRIPPPLSVFALPPFTMTSMYQAARNQAPATRQASDFMNLRLLRTSVVFAVPFVFGAALLVGPGLAHG